MLLYVTIVVVVVVLVVVVVVVVVCCSTYVASAPPLAPFQRIRFILLTQPMANLTKLLWIS